MLLVVAALVVAGGVALAGLQVARQVKSARDEAERGRALQVLSAFAPALAAAQDDPRALLSWAPIAAAARRLCPDELATIDRAFGATFPFSDDAIAAAHARWTSDW